MTKRKSNPEDEIQANEQMMRALGYIPCPDCSVPNWTIWHKPGNHQPANGSKLDLIGRKMTTLDEIDESKVGKG